MAGSREAKITFRAETSEFDANLKKARSTMQDLRSELRLNESEFKNTGDKAKYYGDQAKLLEAQLSANRDKQQALNSEIEVAKRVFGEDSEEVQKLQRQLNYAQTEENNLKNALNSCNAELQKSQSATEQLNSKIESQERELRELTNQYKNVVLEQGKESTEAKQLEKEITDLNSELRENKSKMKDAETAAESLTREMDDLENETKQADSGFTTFKGTLANLAAEGLSRAADAIKDLSKEVLDIGMSFEDSMAKVKALSGASGDEFEALKDKAKELGSSTRFTASEVADGFGYMSLAGWDTADMLDGVTGVLNLAQAAEMDLGEASDIVTDYLTAFGLSASDSANFVDQMTYAMANSNTDAAQLGEAYKNCASTAASMGISVEDTTAVLMTMANAGVKGGEAGTALNAVMTRLATNTSNCGDVLADLGIEVYDSQGNMNDLSTILEGLAGKWGDLSEEEQAAISKTIAGQNHYSAFQTILAGVSEKAQEGGQSFQDYREALNNCGGAAEEMARIMNDTASGDLAAMQSAFEGVGNSIFEKLETPLRDVIQFITSTVVPGLQFMVDNFNVIGPIILGVATAVGVLIAAMNFSTIIGAIQGVTTAITGMFSAMLANPIGIVIALVAGLVVAFIGLWNNCEEFRNFWIGVWDALVSFFQPFVDAIANGISAILENFGFLQPVIEGIGGVFGWLGDTIGAAWDFITGKSSEGADQVEQSMDSMEQATEDTMANMEGSTSDAMANMEADTSDAMANMDSDTADAMSNMQGNTNDACADMASTTSSSMSTMQSDTSSALGSMESEMQSAYGNMADAANTSFTGISADAQSEMMAAQLAVTNELNTATQNLTDSVTQMTTAMSSGVSEMTSTWNNAHFSTPHIPLPHFSVSGQLDPNVPSVPTFSVSWYKEGGILNAATIFGMAGNTLLGGGEAGKEAVLPIDLLQDYIDTAFDNHMAGDSVDRIVDAIDHLADRVTVLELNGHEIARTTAGNFDYVNGVRQTLATRGVAL